MYSFETKINRRELAKRGKTKKPPWFGPEQIFPSVRLYYEIGCAIAGLGSTLVSYINSPNSRVPPDSGLGLILDGHDILLMILAPYFRKGF